MPLNINALAGKTNSTLEFLSWELTGRYIWSKLDKLYNVSSPPKSKLQHRLTSILAYVDTSTDIKFRRWQWRRVLLLKRAFHASSQSLRGKPWDQWSERCGPQWHVVGDESQFSFTKIATSQYLNVMVAPAAIQKSTNAQNAHHKRWAVAKVTNSKFDDPS